MGPITGIQEGGRVSSLLKWNLGHELSRRKTAKCVLREKDALHYPSEGFKSAYIASKEGS